MVNVGVTCRARHEDCHDADAPTVDVLLMVLPSALRQITRSLGPDDRFLFETRHSPAVVMGQLGRLEECQAELSSVEQDRSRVLGVEHPDTLAARAYLTWALALRGKSVGGHGTRR